jgi:beta-glucosidase
MEFYPLYPFGYGLSYTQFRYSNLQTRVNDDGTVRIQADVTNTGAIAGDEVVQLYVTDMYASVKTRVMELKGFDRVALHPNETKTVDFILTPYQLSLLNDRMDRVVESGEFKINVGGKSPSYRAADRIKDNVKYNSDAEGLTGTFDYRTSFAADFDLSYAGMEENLVYNKKRAVVKVKNTGNLMDTGKAYMFVNGTLSDEVHHYELAAGEEKTVTFDLDKDTDVRQLVFTVKYKNITVNF